jgi:DNA polymerase I-like protein with 3'-5' exonuclease and polymerase domains
MQRSTGADGVEGLALVDKLQKNVPEYRKPPKLESAYADFLRRRIHSAPDRMYTGFGQGGTAGGRLSVRNRRHQNGFTLKYKRRSDAAGV